VNVPSGTILKIEHSCSFAEQISVNNKTLVDITKAQKRDAELLQTARRHFNTNLP
jgi:hypothetical protein